MDFITKIFNMDLGKLVPDLAGLLDKAMMVIDVSVMVGPVVMLLLGLIYLLIPPKEANYSFGYRTYFGMGSVEAWRFTQKVAGITYIALGIGLLIAMLILTGDFQNADTFDMVMDALKYLLLQAGVALFARLIIGGLAAVFFTSYGDRRDEDKHYE